jgi:hypothetical protein
MPSALDDDAASGSNVCFPEPPDVGLPSGDRQEQGADASSSLSSSISWGSDEDDEECEFCLSFRRTAWGCLWPRNETARKRFGDGSVHPNGLCTSNDLMELMVALCDQFYFGHGSWTSGERAAFEAASATLFPRLTEELGPEFVIFDERAQSL